MLLKSVVTMAIILLAGVQISVASTMGVSSKIPTDRQSNTAYIALIIDDMGYRLKNDLRALSLKAKISYAILPNTPYANKLANLAHQQNQELLLHLPMESLQLKSQEADVLTSDLAEQEFIQLLEKNLYAVPFISGINNHMGSALTTSEKHMNWLMSFLKTTDLFFIDSRTTSKTVAEKVAQLYQIPNSRRDVFLDHIQTRKAIEEQYQRLIKLAIRKGSAVAIGHPYSMTLEFLEKNLPELASYKIKLVSVKELIDIQNATNNNFQRRAKK